MSTDQAGGATGDVTVVVLAGGTSRRFGSDKLAQLVDGSRLLDLAVSQLPAGAEVIVVGPETPGGPAAALVVGLRRALTLGPDAVVVLPGDAPQAGLAAAELLAHLSEAGANAVVALDPDGQEQPLQLALRPAAAVALADGLVEGRLDLEHLRGRSDLSMPVQAAEIDVRRRLDLTGLDDVRPVSATADGDVTTVTLDAAGRTVRVRVRRVLGDAHRLTCGALRDNAVPRFDVDPGA